MSGQKLMTPHDLPASTWALLGSLGLPDRLISLRLEMSVGEPILATASFYLCGDDGAPLLIEGELAKGLGRFHIVALEPLPTLKGRLAALGERIEAAARRNADRPTVVWP